MNHPYSLNTVFFFFFFCASITSMAQDREPCITEARNRKLMQANLKVTKGTFARSLTWPGNTLLHISFLGGTNALRDSVRKYAAEWTQYANVQFQFVNGNNGEIRIAFDENDGNWSYLGTMANNIAPGMKTMNLGSLPRLARSNREDAGSEVRRKVLHEFGHALGLEHEHLSPHAGFKFNLPALYAYYAAPPNNWSQEEVDSNILKTVDESNTNGKYDISSIMLYYLDPSVFSVPGEYTRYNTILSDGDKETIAMLYPKTVSERTESPSGNIIEVNAYVSDQTNNLTIYPHFTINNANYLDCDIIIEFFSASKTPIKTNMTHPCTYYYPETGQVVGYRKITPAYINTVYNNNDNQSLGISTPLSCLLLQRNQTQRIQAKVLIRANKNVIMQTDYIPFTINY